MRSSLASGNSAANRCVAAWTRMAGNDKAGSVSLSEEGGPRAEDWLLDASMESLVNDVEKLSVSLEEVCPAQQILVPSEGGILLASLYSIRPFTPRALERLMISLWKPVYGVSMVEKGPNLLLFSFNSKVDMSRVLEEGPWRFDDHFLLLKEISDPNKVDREVLRGLPIWIQMHNIPYAWLTKRAAVAIGEKLGVVLSVDENSEGLTGLGFLRARIEIDVAEPLPRKLKVTVGKTEFWTKFKFEKLPNFCYKCGILDHIEMYCRKPVVRDENGIVQVWEHELRSYPPRRQVRPPLRPPRLVGFQRSPGRAVPSEVTLGPPPGLESKFTGREPFKRKRMSRQSSPTKMDGVVTEDGEARVAGI